MSVAVNHHPPREQLRKFVEGELSAGLSVAISAHIEICKACQRDSEELEAEAVTTWDASIKTRDNAEFSAMLDKIVSQAQEKTPAPRSAVTTELKIDNRIVNLPRVLAKVTADGLSWRKLGGGITQATVKLDDRTRCEFIYMAPGSKAPQHTHRGNEVMLVLDGSFNDELGEYHAADFVLRDPSHRHQPRTEKGCLCFSVLDSPLIFTEGFLRLLNPLNRLMFWKTLWYR